MRPDEGRRFATVILPETRSPVWRRWVLLLIVLAASGAAAVDPGPMRVLGGVPERLRMVWRQTLWGDEVTWDGAAVLPPLPPGEASAAVAVAAPDSGAASPVVSPPGPTSSAAPPVPPSRPPRPAAMSRNRSGDRAAAPRVRSRVAAPAAVAAGSRPPPAKPVSAPPSDSVAQVALPGQLSVHSVPWGVLYVDGRLIGNTPRVDLPVAPGPHRIRVERTGFVAFDTTITILAGAPTRLTGVTLQSTP